MGHNQEKENFVYTYSAKEKAEIERIRRKYLPEEEKEDKMEQLRRLDRSVTAKAQTLSLIIGVVGALVLGVGMCFAMEVLAQGLMALGIVIGLLGIGLMAVAYPVYNATEKKERERIAPEILRLSDELMK